MEAHYNREPSPGKKRIRGVFPTTAPPVTLCPALTPTPQVSSLASLSPLPGGHPTRVRPGKSLPGQGGPPLLLPVQQVEPWPLLLPRLWLPRPSQGTPPSRHGGPPPLLFQLLRRWTHFLRMCMGPCPLIHPSGVWYCPRSQRHRHGTPKRYRRASLPSRREQSPTDRPPPLHALPASTDQPRISLLPALHPGRILPPPTPPCVGNRHPLWNRHPAWRAPTPQGLS
jgi:hypothetical protein